MAVLRAVVWWVPALLVLLAVGVALTRDVVARAGGLEPPYPDAPTPAQTAAAPQSD